MKKGRDGGEKSRAESIKLEITPEKKKGGIFGFGYSCYLDRLEKH